METKPPDQRLPPFIYFIISMDIQLDKPKRLGGIHIATKAHRLAVSNWFQVLKHPHPTPRKGRKATSTTPQEIHSALQKETLLREHLAS